MTVSSTHEQRRRALNVANDKRGTLAAVRADIRAGRRPVADVLREPPECLHSKTVAEVLWLAPRYLRRRVAILNEYAMRDGVNLLALVGSLDAAQVEWIVRHVTGGPLSSAVRTSRSRARAASVVVPVDGGQDLPASAVGVRLDAGPLQRLLRDRFDSGGAAVFESRVAAAERIWAGASTYVYEDTVDRILCGIDSAVRLDDLYPELAA